MVHKTAILLLLAVSCITVCYAQVRLDAGKAGESMRVISSAVLSVRLCQKLSPMQQQQQLS